MQPEVAEAWACAILAGPLPDIWACGPLAETARHEARHAVIARALGLHVGGVSVVPVEDAAGWTQVSPHPITQEAKIVPGEFKLGGRLLPDLRKALLLMLWYSPGEVTWRKLMSSIRRLRKETEYVTFAHRDVIQMFAWDLVEAGRMTAAETNAAFERAEAVVDARVIAEFVQGQPPEYMESSIGAVARLRAAALQLIDAGTTGDVNHLLAIVAATETAGSLRGADVQFLDDLALHQPRAVRRLAHRLCSEAADIVVGPESITVSL